MINVPVKDLAICHVFRSGTLLLIKPTEGIGKDKWNAPGGEIVQGDKPEKSAIKYLYQQTGLYASKVFNNGTVRLALNGQSEFSYRLHIFSTKTATGELKPAIQGEVKWFNLTDIPYFEMWADDRYWLNLVMQGKQFDADFFFDEHNEKVVKYQIKERQNVVKNILPIILVALIIAVVGYGVVASGILNYHPKATTTISKNTIFSPPPNTPTTITTTIATTTVNTIPTPTVLQIDNIDLTLNYSGPAYKNNTACDVPSKLEVVNYHKTITSNTFLLNITFIDAGCPETITRIYTTTPGFTINSTVPQVPQPLPASSSVYFDIRLVAQTKSFLGPLSITENYQ